MTIDVEAVIQDGLQRPKQAIALADGTEVLLTIETGQNGVDPLGQVIGIGFGPEQGDVAERHDDYLYGRT